MDLSVIFQKDFNPVETPKLIREMFQMFPSYSDAFLACKTSDDIKQLTCMLKTIYQDYPPKKDEVRGMWHRPFESSLDMVIQTLSDLKSMGINHLFVETFYNGQLIFDSQNSLTHTHAFVGFYGPYGTHLLKAFIEEGKKQGISIHAWVENFFIGHSDHPKDHDLLKQKPHWAMENHDHTILQKQEKNYLFIDPAQPEVQAYLKKIYQDIINSGELASLHLDYIRYPVSYQGFNQEQSDDTGYSNYAISLFKKQYHIKGDMRSLVLNDQTIFNQWSNFKINIINQFVYNVHMMAKKNHVSISTAVFGDPNHALKVKMQDWLTWVKNGWIDIICPMAYYQQDTRVYHEVKTLIDKTKTYCVAYAGIAPSYIGLDPLANLSQVIAARKAGAQGVIFFATQNYLSHSFMGQNEKTKEAFKVLKHYVSQEAFYKKELLNYEKHL